MDRRISQVDYEDDILTEPDSTLNDSIAKDKEEDYHWHEFGNWNNGSDDAEASELLQTIIDFASLGPVTDTEHAKEKHEVPPHKDDRLDAYSPLKTPPTTPVARPTSASPSEIPATHTDHHSHCCNVNHDDDQRLDLADLSDDEFDLLTYANCCSSSQCFSPRRESTMNILLDELSRPSCESPGETISVSDSPRSSEPTFSEQNTPEKSTPDSSEFSPASSVETPPKSHVRVYSLLAKPSVRFPKLKQCLTMSSIKQRQPELITSSQTTVSTPSSPKASSHSQAAPNPQEATQFVRMRERPRGADFPQPEPDNFLSLPMLLGSEPPVQFTKIKPRPRGNPQEACCPLGVEGSSPPNDNSNLAFADRQPQPRREADEPRRPKNGFIRFSIEHRAEMLQKYPYKDNRTISKLLGLRWKKMTREEKRPYEEEFSKDIHEIRSQNPEWRYAPAKRSVEELIDPMEKRLRPRQKLRTKSPELVCCHKNAKHSSCCEQGHFCKGRQLLQEEKNRQQQCDFCGQCCSHASPYQLPRISYAWCPVGQAYQSNVYQRVGESTLNPNTHLQSINIPTSLSAGVSAQLIQLPIQHGNHQLSIQHSSNQAGLTLQPQVFVVLPGFATLNPASYGTSNSVSQTVYPQSQTQFHHQAGFESQLLSSGLQTQQP